MVAAGHWRAETEEEKKTAWEESVRLRERMFWTRVGGGVVPSFVPLRDSPRSPTFGDGESKIAERMSEESVISFEPRDITVDGPASATLGPRKSEDDPFQSKDGDGAKRISIGKTVISGDGVESDSISNGAPDVRVIPDVIPDSEATNTTEEQPAPPTLSADEEKQIEQQAEAQLHDEVRRSLDTRMSEKPVLQRQRSRSNPPPVDGVERKKEDRLSLRIPSRMPGGFE
jgi:hypothetical protein